MNYYQQLLDKLRQPIPYQWRVQSRSKDKSKAICTAYIDARDVMNVLDNTCEHGWEVSYSENQGFIFAGIGINVLLESPGRDPYINQLWRYDCGQRVENDPADQMYEQAGKSAASDAFKRAAVMWGVGRFLYDLDKVILPCDQYGNPVDNQGNKIWNITEHINNMRQAKQRAEQTMVLKDVGELPPLPQEKLDAMLKFINDGKIKEVESAMKKYKLSPTQKTVLTTMISQVKAEQVTKAAKK
jgi:hypothetical protein